VEIGSVDDFLDVTVECSVLDQGAADFDLELDDRVVGGLTSDDRKEPRLHAVD
jgi:hypothetical protein